MNWSYRNRGLSLLVIMTTTTAVILAQASTTEESIAIPDEYRTGNWQSSVPNTSFEDLEGKVKKDCFLPMVAGHCRALIPMYYYNSTLGNCTDFDYGGCGGNANRFISKENCLALCGGS